MSMRNRQERRRLRRLRRLRRSERQRAARLGATELVVLEPLERRLLFSAAVITGVSPSENSHAAPVSTDITATYDQNIDTGGSVTDTTFVVHAMQTGQILSPPHGNAISVVTDTITFNPDNDFKPGEMIQVIATDGIQNTLAEASVKRVWEFRAAATGGTANFIDTGQTLGDHLSYGVAVGDLDGDGDLDAYVVNYNTGGNRVWLNDGSGNFTDNGQDLGNHDSMGVALGDVDGDGDLDAFVTNGGTQGNRVWLNDGSGNFTDSGQALGSQFSLDVALGDLDGDGDLDAYVTNGNQANRVWLNDGSGNFTNSGQALGNHVSRGVGLGDLDGDGDLDAFVANGGFAHQGQRVWINDGSGHFTDSGQDLGNHHSFGVALGDVDGDGDLDAFVVNGGFPDANNRVWLNDGSGNFTDSGQALGDHNSLGVELGDLDGDGDLDAFDVNLFQGNRVWLNDGSGNFTDSGQDLGNHHSFGVALGDVDGDGDLDAFVANQNQGDRVWLNQPPQVTEVLVRGSAWTQPFLDELDSLGLGDDGYSIPIGSVDQLDPVPWPSIDQILIRFNEPVTVDQTDLVLTGVNVATYTLSSLTTGTGANGEFEAVWTLPTPILTDKLRITLDGTSGVAVVNTNGKVLDGEWTDTVSTYHSGDDLFGGDFAFRFNVLHADSNGDGFVTLNPDVQNLLNGLGTANLAIWMATATSTPSTLIGVAGYSPLVDYNGDGLITLNPDAQTLLNNLGTTLPVGDPSAPAPVTAGSSGPSAVVQSAPVAVATDTTTSSEIVQAIAVPTRGHAPPRHLDTVILSHKRTAPDVKPVDVIGAFRAGRVNARGVVDLAESNSEDSIDLLENAGSIF